MGTPRYLPPEALHGAGEVGPLSDQYSLAVVLYQCVTGRTPFAGDTLLALLESLSKGAFESPRSVRPSISHGLDRVITRAMSPDPEDRFPTIRDMGCALLALAGERTQMVWGPTFRSNGARAPAWPDRSPSSRERAFATERIAPGRVPVLRRWRRLLIGAALMLTGALVAALWSELSGGGPRPSATQASSAPPPETQREAERLPAVATPPAAPQRGAGAVTAVLGLLPPPVEREPESPPMDAPARLQRAPGAQAARPPPAASARHAEREARAPARRRAESANATAAAPTEPTAGVAPEPSPASTASPPPEAPTPVPQPATTSEPATTAPRHGANRSPLLD
jgi:serine/threonine-protein kinase